MDHNKSHLRDPAAILEDLKASKTALELLLKSGKARELELTELEREGVLEINGGSIPHGLALQMIQEARNGREFSYAPYSHFNVGAAVLASSRHGLIAICNGCNVENAAYSPTFCGECTAVCKAVSAGFRRIHAYATVGGFDDSMPQALRDAAANDYITPCGRCRQVTKEFEVDPCIVIAVQDVGKILVSTLEFLLPAGFGPRTLGVDPTVYDRHMLPQK